MTGCLAAVLSRNYYYCFQKNGGRGALASLLFSEEKVFCFFDSIQSNTTHTHAP
jgi:hypothetical protein